MLDRYRLMTYGLQIVRAVEALDDASVHRSVVQPLEHLIVDEYQDVNPAQERLIHDLAKPVGGADLVAVGDDDQAIYQWRGSNVNNIVTFENRYPNVTQFHLLTNRRFAPEIVDVANSFATTIPGRLAKQMLPYRPDAGPAVDLGVGYNDEQLDADTLAMTIQHLAGFGVPYRTMAVLVRGRAAYEKILDAASKTLGTTSLRGDPTR